MLLEYATLCWKENIFRSTSIHCANKTRENETINRPIIGGIQLI